MTKSQAKVAAARTEVKRLWSLMCEHDKINPTSLFVVMDPANPLTAEYNAAALALQVAIKNEIKNQARRDKHAAYTSCGLKRVKGALGGVYYE